MNAPSQERSTYVPLLKLLYPTLGVSPILTCLPESLCHSIRVDWVMYIPTPSPTESDASEDRSALTFACLDAPRTGLWKAHQCWLNVAKRLMTNLVKEQECVAPGGVD